MSEIVSSVQKESDLAFVFVGIFPFFFLNVADGFYAGLSLDSKAIILYMSNFLLGVFIEVFLKQNVSSQII